MTIAYKKAISPDPLTSNLCLASPDYPSCSLLQSTDRAKPHELMLYVLTKSVSYYILFDGEWPPREYIGPGVHACKFGILIVHTIHHMTVLQLRQRIAALYSDNYSSCYNILQFKTASQYYPNMSSQSKMTQDRPFCIIITSNPFCIIITSNPFCIIITSNPFCIIITSNPFCIIKQSLHFRLIKTC